MILRINILQCKVRHFKYTQTVLSYLYSFLAVQIDQMHKFKSQDVKNWNAGIHSLTMIIQTNAIVVWSSVTINTDVNLKVYKIMMRQLLFYDIRFVFLTNV